MKPNLSQKVKTGLFIVIGIGILLATVFIIGNQKNMFSSNFVIHANFKNISGLQVGNLVRFAGINVGTVDNIAILNDSTVQVSLQIQKSVKKFIKQDAFANIGSDGLMGDKIIQVSSGTMATAEVKENSLITGKNPMNMDEVMVKLNGIATNAETLTGNLADIVGKINNGEGSLGRLINNDQLARNLEGTISSTNETVKSIKKGADGFSDNMEAAKSNFLLKGFFKKKEKQRIADSTKKAQEQAKGVQPKKN
jgi:phospholipid/cholesterol/gamma-HCH transport system substrate-binding protein